jgi:3-methyladenine DNA glycosylase AlkC
MAEALKNRYNVQFFNEFKDKLLLVYPEFKGDDFLSDIFIEKWESLELKDRMYHISAVLKDHLPPDFEAACKVIRELMTLFLNENPDRMTFEHMFLGDFIEKNGQKDLKTAFITMEEITKMSSCEFAIRPFIINHQKETLQQLKQWAKSKHHMVRRLASEGSRPLLPWGMVIQDFKADPRPILPILELLHHDPAEIVRKSVANHLNDISKNQPEIVKKLCKKWKGESPEVDKVIKHGLRTLLKQGDPEALQLFGYANVKDLEIQDFKVLNNEVVYGNPVNFTFSVKNLSKTVSKVRLEYALYFLRSNGSHNKKVFMISERELKPGEQIEMSKNHPFKPISTRKYYNGKQKVELIINGLGQGTNDFELKGVQ